MVCRIEILELDAMAGEMSLIEQDSTQAVGRSAVSSGQNILSKPSKVQAEYMLRMC